MSSHFKLLLLLLLLLLIALARCNAAFVYVTSDRISDAPHNFHRIKPSLNTTVAFSAASNTSVYISSDAVNSLSLIHI